MTALINLLLITPVALVTIPVGFSLFMIGFTAWSNWKEQHP